MRQHPRTRLHQFVFVVAWVVPISYFSVPWFVTTAPTVQLSSVPIWPSNGIVPKEVSNQYVFYDPRTEEYVVAYPENLGTPDFERNSGRLLISRFPTTKGAKPFIQFSIVRDQEKYRYTYRLANAEGAKRSITSWYLATPV